MIWMMLSAVVAYFVKGLTGFANTLIFNTLLSFTSDNVNISPVELVVSYPTNLVIAWRERRSINWRACLPVAALMLLGDVPGILLLRSMDASRVKLLFGAVIIGVGVEMLLRERVTEKKKSSRAVLAVIGVLSGLLSGLYGIGVLLAAYMSRVTDDSSAFRGSLCLVFLIENTFRLILYIVTGILTWPLFTQALCLLPAMALGLFLGIKCTGLLPERTVRRVIVGMLMLSGVALIAAQL